MHFARILIAGTAVWACVGCGNQADDGLSGASECLQTGEELLIQHRTPLPDVTRDTRMLGLAVNEESVAALAYELTGSKGATCIARLVTLDRSALHDRTTIVTDSYTFEVACDQPLVDLAWDGARWVALGTCGDGVRQAVVALEPDSDGVIVPAEIVCLESRHTGLEVDGASMFLLDSSGLVSRLSYPDGLSEGEATSAGDRNVTPAYGLGRQNGISWLGRDAFEASMTNHLTRVASSGAVCTYPVELDTGVRAELPAAYGSEVWVIDAQSVNGKPNVELLWLQDGGE